MATSSATHAEPSLLSLLDPQYLAMIERGVPTVVASADAALRPSVSMAVGCMLDTDAGEVTVFVSRIAAARLLGDIAAHGRIAVMCVEPLSHRAVQLKSGAVRSRAAGAGDEPALARFLASVENELLEVGHTREFTRCIMAQRTGELVALTFAPEQAFDQAPGPSAGTSLHR